MAIGPWSPNAAGNEEYKLRQEIATLTVELERVKAERDAAPEKESERWAERFNFLHTEYGADCSGTDSGDLLDLVEAEVRQALQKVEEERDAALKDQARYRGLRAIIAAQRFVPVEQVDEETDAAIAAREG